MNGLQVFLKTRIKNTGFLAELGNFFLAPARFFLFGKTILIKEGGASGDIPIAKVSSFNTSDGWDGFRSKGHRGHPSKQDSNLRSTNLWEHDDKFFLAYMFFALVVIPSTILGSIFKAFSYFNPTVQKSHAIVKEKLTPKDITIIDTGNDLLEQLRALLMTGQKIGILEIHRPRGTAGYTEETMYKITAAIKKLNPSKIILDGITGNDFPFAAHFAQRRPWSSELYMPRKWDYSALYDGAGYGGGRTWKIGTNSHQLQLESNVVSSVEVAKQRSLGVKQRMLLMFFGRQCPKHVVYVVSNEAQAIQQPKL